MARPLKNGLDYFPMDVDFFDDDKIAFVSAKFKSEGELIAIKLLCRIYRNGYYCKWGEDEAILFAMKTLGNIDKLDILKSVVEELLERDFFNKELFEKYGVLTSRGIQKRYEKIFTRNSRKVKNTYPEINLLESDKTPQKEVEKELNGRKPPTQRTKLTEKDKGKGIKRQEMREREREIETETEREREITHAHVIIKNEKYIPIGDLPRHANLSLPISSSFFNFNTKDKKIFKVTNKHIATMTAKFTNLEVTLILARYRMFLERNPDKLVLASEFLDNLRDRFRDWDVEALEFPQFSGKKSLSYAKFEGYFEFKTKDNNTVRIDDSEVNKLQEDYPNIDVVAKLNNYKGYLEDNEDRRPRKENLMKNITEKFEAWNAEAEEKTNRMKIKAEEHIPDYNNPYFRLRHNIN